MVTQIAFDELICARVVEAVFGFGEVLAARRTFGHALAAGPRALLGRPRAVAPAGF